MANKFGMAQDPDILPCAICSERVEHIDKIVVEGETIHKACFKCSLCGFKLQMGHCASDRALYGRYGPRWYCSLICSTRPLAEKEAKLKEMGVQIRQHKKKGGTTDDQHADDNNLAGSKDVDVAGSKAASGENSKDDNSSGKTKDDAAGNVATDQQQKGGENVTGLKDDDDDDAAAGRKESSDQSSKNSNSTKGANKFGMAQDPDILPCAICGERVEHIDKIVVESETIHKACFKCSLCGIKLQMGHCASDRALYGRYGPRWYCSLICATRPLAEKEAKLKEMGVQIRQPKKKE